MVAIEQDLHLIRSGVNDLKDYLLSGELFWPVSISISHRMGFSSIRLTPGNLLLAIARLHAQELSPEYTSELAQHEAKFNEVRQAWLAAWRRKEEREVQSRLTMWGNYLKDYREDPARYAPDYPWEVRWRVILHLIHTDLAGFPADADEKLRALDALLRASLEPGNFIWSPSLQDGFPSEPYWYLYGSLRLLRH